MTKCQNQTDTDTDTDPSSCASSLECLGTYYCLKENCDDPTGSCAIKPEICSDIWDPICGCDHMTYGNDCEAAAAGQNIDYEGECA
jgi:hypothetical protein